MRTPKQCIRKLNLLWMVLLFRHFDGKPNVTFGEFDQPADFPYEWYW